MMWSLPLQWPGMEGRRENLQRLKAPRSLPLHRNVGGRLAEAFLTARRHTLHSALFFHPASRRLFRLDRRRGGGDATPQMVAVPLSTWHEVNHCAFLFFLPLHSRAEDGEAFVESLLQTETKLSPPPPLSFPFIICFSFSPLFLLCWQA